MPHRPRILSLALLAAVLACGSGQPAQPGTVEALRIVALGDSLTAGFGLRASEAYPARLQERMRTAGLPHVVVNEGVSGDTTADALARLDRALSGAQVVIIALGANDGLQGVPIPTVERNLDTIVQRARQQTARVLLCGMETPPARGFEYSLAFHRVYPDLAAKHGVPLMPFLLTGVLGRQELNLPDGIHPNAAGARVIADNLWPYLEPLLR